MKESNCPTCRRPKAAASRGSLTQWVTACTCDLKLPDNQQGISIHFCRGCGKRIGVGRPGSFTQYIFRSDTCRCEFPEPGGTSVARAPQEITQADDDDSIDDEPALEVLPGPFPADRYKPLAMLGQGSSGTVYLARDKLLRKKVAVKVLRGLNPEEVIAFQEEARATSSLRHDGIVKLLDFGLIDSSIPYMVLEYVSGQSLRETLTQSGPLPWQPCVYMAKRLCAALESAHEQGVFHRDIQPSNIIVTREPDDSAGIRLIDFGIAKIVGNSIGSAQSDSLALVGTPFYMSPDQGLGRKYDARSEVYSLGCVLFECLTGRPPFLGETPLETLSMHAEQMPPTLVEAYQNSTPDTVSEKADFPELVQRLVEKCLAKDSDDRYQSMAEILTALEKISETYSPPNEEDALSRLKKDFLERSRKTKIRVFQTVAIGCLCLIGLFIASLLTGGHAPDKHVLDKQAQVRIISSYLPKDVDSIPSFIDAENKTKKPPAIRISLFKNTDWARELEENSTTTQKLTDVFDKTATKITVNVPVDDKFFTDLVLYKNASSMDLSDTKITDAGTAYICSPKLTELNLDRSRVRTMEFVSKLKSLEQLRVSQTLVDNQAMAKLCSLKKLEALDISKTKVNDGAIPYLVKMQSLSSLMCGQTLSKAAIRDLATSMPGCTFIYGNESISGFSTEDVNRVIQTRTNSDAIKYLSHCVSTIEKAHGKNAPQLDRFLTPLAGRYLRERKFEEAKAASDRALRICRDNDNSRWLLTALTYRIQVATAENNIGDAIKYKSEICNLMKQTDGTTRLLLIHTSSLAGSLVHHGDKEQAKKKFYAVIEQAKELSQKKTPLSPKETTQFVVGAWYSLARISQDSKDFGAAEKQMRTMLKLLRANPDHGSTAYQNLIASGYGRLATSNISNNHYDEAIVNQKNCVDICKRYHLPVEMQERSLEVYKKTRDELKAE